ncbi:c-type cytochrome [Rhodosalinus sediminis]|uniref:c-type cytochrome n=1 Tax=Rhodosalinus sediminis TaxID=1940533 RepID=UPI002355B3C9|nr:c-type cytochrome [Rhodosalinus sediminis]
MRGSFIAAAAAAALAGHVAAAQEMTLGEAEYLNSCAKCHGASGAGDGVLAGYLTAEVPGLTRLQAENGGVFPVARMYDVIENSVSVEGHGSSEMPAWGMRYKYRANRALGEYAGPADREAYIEARILALIEHISSLQTE